MEIEAAFSIRFQHMQCQCANLSVSRLQVFEFIKWFVGKSCKMPSQLVHDLHMHGLMAECCVLYVVSNFRVTLPI